MGHRSPLADEAGMAAVVAAYVAGLRGQVAGLRGEMERGEWEALRGRLHQLRGSGASYGFRGITEFAERGEARLFAGDEAGARDAVAGLIGYMEGVEGYDGG